MAEAFARTLGRDLFAAESAGLSPVFELPESTIGVMQEKGIDISEQFPQPLTGLDLKSYDLIVNMTGLPIPSLPDATTRNWIVPDPVGRPDAVLREVRDEIESLVMGLVLEMHKAREQRERPRLVPKLRGV
jgi:arsenate reductase